MVVIDALTFNINMEKYYEQNLGILFYLIQSFLLTFEFLLFQFIREVLIKNLVEFGVQKT